MESTAGSTDSTTAAAMPSPSVAADNSCKATNFEIDPSISEEERNFYLKAYPTVDLVRERKTHCTVCKIHIGTAPVQENGMKMHPILRVTHCNKCHDFYNSGEFSKGEDGSELYCRWCGQGGEVYCCSSCPYVFCKSCIVKNLSKGVVGDIEQNENWSCFNCAPKILWPLRAQHWALKNYIEQQKKEVSALNLGESELKLQLGKDRSKCCRLAKAKCGNMSDSMESLDSVASKRSSSYPIKKPIKHPSSSPQHGNAVKRMRNNDEVVCTPDLLSMLEPDCQITVPPKPNRPIGTPSASIPKIMSIQQPQSGYGSMHSTPKSSAPPPLVLRNTAIKLRPIVAPPVVRRTIIGPRAPHPGGGGSPVYHTINGYRIDLNSAAQQETFRLPNGKLIQVKRQGPPVPNQMSANNSPSINNWQQMTGPQPQRVIPQTIASRPVQITPHPYSISVQQSQGQHPQVVRYHNNMMGTGAINPASHNGSTIQVLNGQISSAPPLQPQQQQPLPTSTPMRPLMVRHAFPDNPVGNARSGLQDQVFNAMEICTHLTNKVQTLTNSNAYKQARNSLEVKELYIHLSYLLTYAIGRFKSLQDKCLGDMRTLGFGNDADCLENGQLAAAVDYVCYGKLEDVDLFDTGSNCFHYQVYAYRKRLHDNLKEDEDGAKSPLPPIFSLSQGKSENVDDEGDGEDSLLEEPKGLKGHWLEGGDESPVRPSFNQENEENEEPDDDEDEVFTRSSAKGYFNDSFMGGTEESMKKNEETYVYDRKLTRLVSQYPSIWCTRHPDYGNFEVTRKQWRTIASHFDGNEHIKLRWKNIRKRFVRIEKRIAEGKRFNGHFDKAMAFLANRDLPEDQWVPVDCGEDDGDTYSRCNLDAIEQSLHLQGKDENVDKTKDSEKDTEKCSSMDRQAVVKPIELESLDLKIMTFVKSNPVLWRKSMDPEADKIDEETRRTVWRQLHRHLFHKQASDDEDNEIQIVEPKTDLITLDSDDDEPNVTPNAQIKSQVDCSSDPKYNPDIKIKAGTPPIPTLQSNRPTDITKPSLAPLTALGTSQIEENMDLMSMAQSFLASMLEVEIQEGPINSPGSDSSGQKKQPRKKLTNKPNPTLLKQKALMERERLEEMKRNDIKLKMKCSVELKKAEEEFPYAKDMLEAQTRETPEIYDTLEKEEILQEQEDETEKEAAIDDNEEMNSSTAEISKSADIELKKTTAESSSNFTENSGEGDQSLKMEEAEETSEKESSVEILKQIEDAKSLEDDVQSEADRSKEDKDDNNSEEISDTVEAVILKSLDENIMSIDIEKHKRNCVQNEEKEADKLDSTDENVTLPITDDGSASRKIEENEISEADNATEKKELDISRNKSTELASETDVKEASIPQTVEESKEIFSDKVIEHIPQLPASNEDKNGDPDTTAVNEFELKSSVLEKENTEEEEAIELPASEEKLINKTIASATERIQTVETPSTDMKEMTSLSSNGNGI